jgi:branched-chain amino acid transport system substrate-binding protein
MAATALGMSLGLAAVAQDLKIGMLTTLSGPGTGLGIDVRDGFRLGLELLGGKLRGVPA